MKAVDVLTAILLIVGGLNWGLFGAFHFDLVAAVLGPFSAISRVVYVLVGLSAVYQAVTFRGMQRRWHGETAAAIR
ncbi:MAG TPA: DUF378 domain-containing protein [Acidobacteriaceae bacterium]|jgi:hypothetical protein|nr:DUF378 domain-containing protein [Acidobacteriaceae bacterium]